MHTPYRRKNLICLPISFVSTRRTNKLMSLHETLNLYYTFELHANRKTRNCRFAQSSKQKREKKYNMKTENKKLYRMQTHAWLFRCTWTWPTLIVFALLCTCCVLGSKMANGMASHKWILFVFFYSLISYIDVKLFLYCIWCFAVVFVAIANGWWWM